MSSTVSNSVTFDEPGTRWTLDEQSLLYEAILHCDVDPSNQTARAINIYTWLISNYPTWRRSADAIECKIRLAIALPQNCPAFLRTIGQTPTRDIKIFGAPGTTWTQDEKDQLLNALNDAPHLGDLGDLGVIADHIYTWLMAKFPQSPSNTVPSDQQQGWQRSPLSIENMLLTATKDHRHARHSPQKIQLCLAEMYQTDARVKMMRAHQRAVELNSACPDGEQTVLAKLEAAKAHEVWSIASARYEQLAALRFGCPTV